MCIQLLLVFTLSAADSFDVTVLSTPILAVRGSTATLPCEFEVNGDGSSLVVTWQRQEDQRVVHSYYYQTDQLQTQSPAYRNRTSLDHLQLSDGNATLSITNFGLRDAGTYLCLVDNGKERDSKEVRLVYAAFFSEPRLSVLLNSTDVRVQYETEGYPKPEVVWLGSGGQIITDRLEESHDEGLFFLKSSYVSPRPDINVTFMLKNPVARQELQRHVTLSFDELSGSCTMVATLSISCTLLLCVILALLYLHFRGRRT